MLVWETKEKPEQCGAALENRAAPTVNANKQGRRKSMARKARL
jgi:hypothetical protein